MDGSCAGVWLGLRLQRKEPHGKELSLAVSVGAGEDAYQAGGSNHFSLSELLRPFQAMANFTGMTYLPAFAMYGVSDADVCGYP